MPAEPATEMTAGPTLAATTVAEQHHLPMVIAHGASTPIYTRGYRYIFGTLNTVDQYTRPIIQMASQQTPPLKTVALINEDALFPQLGIDAAASQASEFGLKVVYKEKYPSGINRVHFVGNCSRDFSSRLKS